MIGALPLPKLLLLTSSFVITAAFLQMRWLAEKLAM
jgi:hypothetical protein